MTNQQLTGNLELSVLACLCWRPDLASTIAIQVTPDLFHVKRYKAIAKAAVDHLTKFNEPIQNHLEDVFENELKKGEEAAEFYKTLVQLESICESIQAAYILAELKRFVTIQKTQRAVLKAEEHLDKGDLEKAQEILYHIDAGVEIDPGIWMSEPDQALSFLDERDEGDQFNLGIRELDNRGVKPERKTLFVLMAPKKRGKSMALVSIGRQAAFVDKKKVLHITLEMSDKLTAQRYVQAHCGWTVATYEKAQQTFRVPIFHKDELGHYTGHEFNSVTPEVLNRSTRNEAAEELNKAFKGQRRLLIKEYPTGTLTMASLNMYLDSLKRTEDFEPDMLIIDYANLMHMNINNVRTETGRIFRELRGIATARNIAVVTATQTNRLSEGSKVVSATHVAEDWSVMGTADIVVTICQKPEEKERRLARILVAAARNVPDGYLVVISQSFENCQFALDSVYMNKVAARDVGSIIDEEMGH